MDYSYPIAIAVVLALLHLIQQRFASPPAPSPREAAETDLRARARQQADATFDLRAKLPDLQEYIRLSSQIISAEKLTSAPVSDIPSSEGRPIDYVKRAVQLAVSQFGMKMPRIKVRFSSLPSGHAARVQQERDGTWKVDVDSSLVEHRESILSAVAHEVAHVALLGRRLRLEPLKRNEELTDAAAVLAGFGPVMLRSVLQESVFASDSGVRLQTSQLGYLPPRALAFLSAVRVELAGERAELYLEHVPDWQRSGVAAYIARRNEWSRLAAGARGQFFDCLACGISMPIPRERAPVRVRCPTCTLAIVVNAAG